MSEFRQHAVAWALLLCLAGIGLAAPASGKVIGTVTIIRDSYGVPHVFGSNLRATWYGVGYASAQDRLWQAEVLRRLGTGTTAEIFGPSALAGDIQARTVFGPPSRRAALYDATDARTKKVIKWYAKGFDAWIQEATATGQLPVEFAALGLPAPRAWTIDDSLAIAMALFNRFGEGGSDEFDFLDDLTELVARLGAGTGAAVFFDSHWLDDPGALTSVPASGPAPAAAQETALSAAELDEFVQLDVRQAARQYRRRMAGWERNLRLAGVGPGPASNAIAIGPKLTADGRPLLLHGPQMGYTVPQINHEVGVHGGGFDVTGMTIAGIPGIPIGVTRKHAWTWTTGGTDNTDIYLEQTNPENPAQYFFIDGYRNFDCWPEVFNVAGGEPVQQVLCASVHGPVVATQPGLAVTLKSAARGREVEGMAAALDMAAAGSFKEFKAATRRAVYNFNVLYADHKGNIAYWHVGKIPIRAQGDNPWFPHIGAGIAEWQGFIPFTEMPFSRNPAQGWLTSWNNKPKSPWPNSTRGFSQWGPVARVATLMNVLETIPPGGASVGVLEQINQIGAFTTDTPSGNASTVVVSTLLGDLLGHVDPTADPRFADVLAIFANWNLLQLDADRDGDYDNPAVAIFNTWWQTFIGQVFADELGGTMERNVVANMAGRLLRPGIGRPLIHDYLNGISVGNAVTTALIDTLDALTQAYGSDDPAAWQQPAAVIDWDPIGAADVPDIPWMNRGTYNQISRVARGNAMWAENVIAPGQSGDPFNPHYADQLLNYVTFDYKVMNLKKQDLNGERESKLKMKVRN